MSLPNAYAMTLVKTRLSLAKTLAIAKYIQSPQKGIPSFPSNIQQNLKQQKNSPQHQRNLLQVRPLLERVLFFGLFWWPRLHGQPKARKYGIRAPVEEQRAGSWKDGGLKLLGRAEIPWNQVFESPCIEKLVTMVLTGGHGKVNKREYECGCKDGHDYSCTCGDYEISH
ncbi:hypothetical protein SO802_025215 [Lithocarpus litseifolius]|uniref:Uncharacterized protein n=1 Tax=Lithocarpus litseifolius TaxID=425828 RepID=A0AAW2BW23_9ROSI